MVINGANKPNLWKNVAVTVLSKGLITSTSTVKNIGTAGKRISEKNYNQGMKKAAGEHYQAKQEAEDGQH